MNTLSCCCFDDHATHRSIRFCYCDYAENGIDISGVCIGCMSVFIFVTGFVYGHYLSQRWGESADKNKQPESQNNPKDMELLNCPMSYVHADGMQLIELCGHCMCTNLWFSYGQLSVYSGHRSKQVAANSTQPQSSMILVYVYARSFL